MPTAIELLAIAVSISPQSDGILARETSRVRAKHQEQGQLFWQTNLPSTGDDPIESFRAWLESASPCAKRACGCRAGLTGCLAGSACDWARCGVSDCSDATVLRRFVGQSSLSTTLAARLILISTGKSLVSSGWPHDGVPGCLSVKTKCMQTQAPASCGTNFITLFSRRVSQNTTQHHC